MYALVNCDVYTGNGVEYDIGIVIDDGKIKAITPLSDLDGSISKIDLSGRCVAPGFIDVQVNGGGGVLFNDVPTLEGIRQIAEAHRKFGTTNLLPTYITGPFSGMDSAIRAVNSAIADGEVKGVLGIHLEGPFLNEGKAGVHDKKFIRKPSEEDSALICGKHQGVVLLTLAPEMVSPEFISQVSNSGVLVSLGHTDATYEEASNAFSHGASCVTHLYNAMSALTSRAPGVVGAALDDRKSWVGMIVDGAHADFVSLRVAMRANAPRKTILVTDSMPPVGAPKGFSDFCLGEYRISVQNGRCLTSDGVLGGSALDMATAVRNCVQKIGLPMDEALRMASTYPAEFLGLGSELGKVAAGYRANLAIFSNQVAVSAVVVEGEYIDVA